MRRLIFAAALALPAGAHAFDSGCVAGGLLCVEGPPTARRPWHGGPAGEANTDEHRRLFQAIHAASGVPDAAVAPLRWTQYSTGAPVTHRSNTVCALPDDRSVAEKVRDFGRDVVGAVLDPPAAVADSLRWWKSLARGLDAREQCKQGTCQPSAELSAGNGVCVWTGPSLAPARFDQVRLATDRQRAPDELTQLPDFGWSMLDLLEGFETCPVDIADNADCHTFGRHMGAYNSSHFPPQSQSFYAHYHQLALARAEACAATWADVPADDRFARFRAACFGEAMAYEAIAQHFLQDAWSVGHTWQRWGAPEPGAWGAYYEAHLIALTAGMLHGAKTVTGWADALNSPDDHVHIRVTGEDGRHRAVGDLYLERVLDDPAYATQRDRLLACAGTSLRDVYRAGGEPFGALEPGDTPELDAVDPAGAGCHGQRATNAAMRRGAALYVEPIEATLTFGQLLLSQVIINLSVASRGRAGDPSPARQLRTEAQFQLDMAALWIDLTVDGLGDPDGTGLADGGLSPVLGVRPNGEYLVADGLPASYVDVAAQGDPRAAEAPARPAERRQHALHPAYAADWCAAFDGSDARYDLETLRDRVEATHAARDDDPSDLDATRTADAACRVCLDFAERHARVGAGPEAYDASREPVCHYLAGDQAAFVYVPADNCDGSLPPELVRTPAERYCGCADPNRGWGNGRLSVSCQGEGCSTGDPHLTTLDGLAYDFQAAGEFVLVSDEAGVEVQVRQAPDTDQRCGAISINTAVSATIGGSRVSVFADEPGQVWIDGEPVALAGVHAFADCSRLSPTAEGYVLVWASGEVLRVERAGDLLNLGFRPAADRAGAYRGLLGDFDGDPTNDLRRADGRALPVDPLPGELLYGAFREDWRAVNHTRLFEDRPDEGPGAFDRDDFPGALENLTGFGEDERALARAVCRDAGVTDEGRRLDECTLDVVCSGDPASARAFVGQGEPAAEANVTDDDAPLDPHPEGCTVLGSDLVSAERPTARIDCPAGCEDSGSVWGTDVYTDDSRVCRAAIHAGHLAVGAPGRVYLEHRPGQAAYPGSTRNGVTTSDWGEWANSFEVVDAP